MLFDLRGRGRRRVVRVIYISLALLMGIGFVGFGVGSLGGGGGLFNAATNNEGSNAASFANQIKKYEKITKQHPRNLSAWESLTKNLLHEAGGEEFTTSQGVVTEQGRDLYIRASHAWNSYIALNPPKPSAELAQLMLNVYGETGLNQPEKAVEVLQIVVTDRPTAAYYAQLGLYAYKAHQDRIGDLASAKAVRLAPANQRKGLKKQLAELKKSASAEATKAASSTTAKALPATSKTTGVKKK
ncbi:MAG TPA: hypothetical protein VFY36_09950 [Solirubrobacteraceae bacterium]|nr:hypothetical protein [Solirubrobacteraceae bacterium]